MHGQLRVSDVSKMAIDQEVAVNRMLLFVGVVVSVALYAAAWVDAGLSPVT